MSQLKRWREGLENPTLRYAAEILGISHVQLFRYENGSRKIPKGRAIHIESVTGIPAMQLRPDLFGEKNNGAGQ